MNRTNIETIKNPDGTPGYTWNPISGCNYHTPEGLCRGGMFPCYAFRLANTRLKERYLANRNFPFPILGEELLKAYADPFYPRFWEDRLKEQFGDYMSGSLQKGIFVCDMSDLFGIGVPKEWTRKILEKISQPWYKEHRFYLSTKQPQNLPQWSPFPGNCRVGVTVTKPEFLIPALDALDSIQCLVRYLSIEPMLGKFDIPDLDILLGGTLNQVIIGACTGTKAEMVKLIGTYPELTLMPYGNKWTAQPKIEWMKEIVQACDKAGVKVFLKNNLKLALPFDKAEWAWTRNSYFEGRSSQVVYTGLLRQEVPVCPPS